MTDCTGFECFVEEENQQNQVRSQLTEKSREGDTLKPAFFSNHMIRTARIFLEVTMARPKKIISDPKMSMSMEQLLNRAVTLFQEPYDDRDERVSSLPSLRTVKWFG